MKLHYLHSIIILLMLSSVKSYAGGGCLAGTASVQQDSICYEDTTTLLLTGYTGTQIQWQSFNGSIWVNEAAVGSTTDTYAIIPGQTRTYRALVSDGVCTPDTSNQITVTVGVLAEPSAVSVSRCGPGMVTLTGTASGTIQWYSDSLSTVPAGTGSQVSIYIPQTMPVYMENTAFGGPGNSPIKVTELDLDDFSTGDDFEITNVAPYDVDVTGWKIAISDDYTSMTFVNSTILTLSGTMVSGEVHSWNDVATSSNYFGNNMFWTGGSGGWIAIIDNNNDLVEFVVWEYPDNVVQSAVININGINYTPAGTQWIGPAITSPASIGNGLVRMGNKDNNDATDWNTGADNIGVLNPGMTVPFIGLGCSSPRVAVDVQITPAEAVTATAVPPALCMGASSALSVSSNNLNYIYTWTPSDGLSDTTGSSVTATPNAPVLYIVTGDDGTCSNRDSIFIDVGPNSVAGTASNTVDTVCTGNEVILSLTGHTGSVQWQSNTGSGWFDETAPGNDSSVFIVAPLVQTIYRAVVTSGGCPSDTTGEINITSLVVADPVISDTTVCAPSNATFTAGGQGTMVWYADSAGGDIYSGNPFTPVVTGNTTFYVAAKAGTTYKIGAVNKGIGSVTQSPVEGYGLSFDVERTCILEHVYVYPAQTGNLTINLRAVAGGPILETKSLNVTASTQKKAVLLGWTLNPGTGYRLELGAGSVSLQYNYTGTTYPFTANNSPVTIQGFVNPNFNTTAQYFYFYDWSILEGCISNRVPFNVTTIPGPAIPVITQHDTTLYSSVTTDIQWYYNGNAIPGATAPTLIISQLGTYAVTASSINGCSNTTVFEVITLDIDELSQAGISIYPNPFDQQIQIKLKERSFHDSGIRILNAAGAVMLEEKNISGESVIIPTKTFVEGIYLIEITDGGSIYRSKLVKN